MPMRPMLRIDLKLIQSELLMFCHESRQCGLPHFAVSDNKFSKVRRIRATGKSIRVDALIPMGCPVLPVETISWGGALDLGWK